LGKLQTVIKRHTTGIDTRLKLTKKTLVADIIKATIGSRFELSHHLCVTQGMGNTQLSAGQMSYESGIGIPEDRYRGTLKDDLRYLNSAGSLQIVKA